ncbi:hypothetical protein [Candidatus Odyssella thessalonicensis]|nr:hypothetical protein [Candidatus Odyssella thessalonicensis]
MKKHLCEFMLTTWGAEGESEKYCSKRYTLVILILGFSVNIINP